MKKLLNFKPLLVFSFAIFLGVLANAQTQPQFKFWLAFEDSVGQKDTLWLYADTNAITEGVDSLYGEVPLKSIDTSRFYVYFKTTDIDSFNVLTQHPENRWFDINIQAQNYRLPIIVRWDSSLFKNNNLPWEIKTALLSHR